MAATGNDPGAPAVGCGAHTATGVPDDARGNLYLYVGGSSGTCTGMDVVRILTVARPTPPSCGGSNANRQCHDNNVIMGNLNLADVRGRQRLLRVQVGIPKSGRRGRHARGPGGIANPTLLYSRQVPQIGGGPAHSGSFTYDGKVLIFGWEPGGGTNPRCQANLPTSPNDNLLFFFDVATGNPAGTMTHTRPQAGTRTARGTTSTSCRRTRATTRSPAITRRASRSSTSPTRRRATEVAYADPRPLGTKLQPTGGDWSTHFYNGKIYQSDIRRGLIIWDLNHDLMRRVRTPDLSNPQTQTASFAQDLEGPAISIAAPLEGAQFKQN